MATKLEVSPCQNSDAIYHQLLKQAELDPERTFFRFRGFEFLIEDRLKVKYLQNVVFLRKVSNRYSMKLCLIYMRLSLSSQ